MNSESIPSINAATVYREEFDDSAILFDPDGDTIFGLDTIGMIVYGFIDGKKTLGQIADEADLVFDASGKNILEDITNFITDLCEKGFIKML